MTNQIKIQISDLILLGFNLIVDQIHMNKIDLFHIKKIILFLMDKEIIRTTMVSNIGMQQIT